MAFHIMLRFSLVESKLATIISSNPRICSRISQNPDYFVIGTTVFVAAALSDQFREFSQERRVPEIRCDSHHRV